MSQGLKGPRMESIAMKYQTITHTISFGIDWCCVQYLVAASCFGSFLSQQTLVSPLADSATTWPECNHVFNHWEWEVVTDQHY